MKNKKKQIRFDLDPEDYKEIKVLAAYKGLTLAELFVEAVNLLIEKEGKEE